MKTNLFNTIEEYKAPECRTLEITFEGMMCTSPGGDTTKPNDFNGTPDDSKIWG